MARASSRRPTLSEVHHQRSNIPHLARSLLESCLGRSALHHDIFDLRINETREVLNLKKLTTLSEGNRLLSPRIWDRRWIQDKVLQKTAVPHSVPTPHYCWYCKGLLFCYSFRPLCTRTVLNFVIFPADHLNAFLFWIFRTNNESPLVFLQLHGLLFLQYLFQESRSTMVSSDTPFECPLRQDIIKIEMDTFLSGIHFLFDDCP